MSDGRRLLWGGALCAGLGAMVLWEGVLGAVFGVEALADDAGSLAWRGRVVLSLGGLALFLIGWLCPGIGRRVSLLLVSCAFPVLGFEAFAGPFVGRDTTIFARDAELGWCLRPGARDSWLGAVVEINVDGMRGPELRTDASQRILFLGDSVVFGAFIERDADTLSPPCAPRSPQRTAALRRVTSDGS